MRIQYSPSISIFLSVLIIISACQGGAHRMYMDSNGSHAAETGYAKEERHAALAPSVALANEYVGTHTQNGNGLVLSVPSSDGVLVPMEQSEHTLQPHSALSDKNAIEEVVQGQDEKKEEVSQASPDLTAWFQRFVDVLDHAEEWNEVAGVLAEGRRHGYLDKSVAWDDDQYTPLHYAAESGNLKVIEELVKRDKIPVDITTGERKRTSLQFATSSGHLPIVKFLVGAGAKVGHVDKQGSNALHYAAAGCDEPSVAIIGFLTQSSETDLICSKVGEKFSVLALALHAANIRLVNYLVDNYPDIIPTAGSEEGQRLLKYANALHDEAVKDKLTRAMETGKT